MSQGQIETIIRVCARNEQTWQDVPAEQAFDQFAEQTGHMLADRDYDVAVGWLHDFDPGEQDQSAYERASRLQELDEMNKDASREYYTAVDAEALQREHLQLLEAGEINDAQFEQAASQASETLDGDYDSQAFNEDSGAEGAADYGDENNGF